ncbi:orotate phosphoribosyltransferase, partial [Patescibacteria group bacterium]|nr:orotate phosphoribosyltransferase [Patescibacteria group bacterium]
MSVKRDDVDQLRDFVQQHCISFGDFTLASGASSSYYYNGKLATLHPPTARIIGEILVDIVVGSGAEAVGGPAVGAIPIACAIGEASLTRDRILPIFIVRMEQKQHGL